MKKYVIFYYEKNRGQKREVCYTLSAANEKAAALEFEYRVFVSHEIDNFVDDSEYRVEAL